MTVIFSARRYLCSGWTYTKQCFETREPEFDIKTFNGTTEYYHLYVHYKPGAERDSSGGYPIIIAARTESEADAAHELKIGHTDVIDTGILSSTLSTLESTTVQSDHGRVLTPDGNSQPQVVIKPLSFGSQTALTIQFYDTAHHKLGGEVLLSPVQADDFLRQLQTVLEEMPYFNERINSITHRLDMFPDGDTARSSQ